MGSLLRSRNTILLFAEAPKPSIILASPNVQCHSPPCIVNDEMMSTSTFIQPQMNGIHVDMEK